ncbi:SDR family NAD(P)-dependent oxidoreductase [Desulfitobacterium sp. AusDCA]|uniref:SDR family NAD(P)-dependent oxidoreductase n=1 Tax=Desulfitobacterium sp. AusDCA TaxID=3240383 RepID=UPI003DA70308
MCNQTDLQDKIALVTGAGQGIGLACAKKLAEHGATVIAADINAEGVNHISKELSDSGLAVEPMLVDVIDPTSVSNLACQIIEKYKKIDILVNNAGIVSRYSCGELPLEQWDRVLDTNLRGTHLMIQTFIETMRKQGSGKIVNISSLAGRMAGRRTSPDYAASKAGVMALTKSYANHYSSHKINVNCVAPGLIVTPMTEGRHKPEDVPLGRLGTAQDIANAVYFLSSPLSDYITGTTIDVNGGMYMN